MSLVTFRGRGVRLRWRTEGTPVGLTLADAHRGDPAGLTLVDARVGYDTLRGPPRELTLTDVKIFDFLVY